MKRKWELTPPQLLEQDLLERYPILNEQVAHFLANDKLTWADWCYLPMSASYAIAAQGADERIEQRLMVNDRLDDFYKLSAIIPWRVSKVIFRFDPDLSNELMKQEYDDIPSGVIMRLPYYCIYIENPPQLPDCVGFFVFLDDDHRYKNTIEVRFHYLFTDGTMEAVFIQITDHDLLSQFMYNIKKTASELSRDASSAFSHRNMERYTNVLSAAGKHLNLVIYLCSDEPDYGPHTPSPRKRKSNLEFAMYPEPIDVGHTIGAVFRKAKMDRDRETANDGGGNAGTHVRPHIRRAHWHTYWTGKQRKTPKVLWVMPVFVGSDTDDFQAVVRPVKPESQPE